MKKSLIFILPLAAIALVGCRRGGGDTTSSPESTTSNPAPTTQTPTITTPSVPTSSGPRPESPWPAVPTGDGSEANPWNVTQAWDYVDQNLEETHATSAAEQAAVRSPQEYYVRGWCNYIEQVSDRGNFAIKFHMADDLHYTTEDEVMNKDANVRQGFCVYFGNTDPAFTSEEQALATQGKLVTVKGYLLNWAYEPEVTSGGLIVDITEPNAA